jgi:molybdate transport system substrate-binding protein
MLTLFDKRRKSARGKLAFLRGCLALLAAAVMLPVPATAAEIRVAVASNFRPAMQVIAKRFENQTGHEVILIFGSTGKQFAQIQQGAPFDAFFAADSQRPAQLEQDGVAVAGTRFTYAVGKLVLWSPVAGYVDAVGDVLKTGDFKRLAIANPQLAPYGRAAQQVLEASGLWESLANRLVRGENIVQAFQFVTSGSAELGFIAYAQIKQPGKPLKGSYWDIPQSLYSPIEQQAVLLKDSEPARAFLQFTQSWEALKIIGAFGYATP